MKAVRAVLSGLLAQLFSRNAEFAKSYPPAGFNPSIPQTPGLFWIGCSDSRLGEGNVIQAKLGEVFVNRNIANVFRENDITVTSGLTYAVNHLKVSDVAVVGHSNCGGCKAALEAALAKSPMPASSSEDFDLYKWVNPIRRIAEKVIVQNQGAANDVLLQHVVEENVKASVKAISNSQIMTEAWKNGSAVVVRGWVYDLATGKMTDLNIDQIKPMKSGDKPKGYGGH